MKRTNPASQARRQRVEAACAEALELHPDATEVIPSFFAGDLFLDVWKDGEGGIARYNDTPDAITAAYTNSQEALG